MEADAVAGGRQRRVNPMQPHTREAEWAIRLLIWTGGVATTIAGSWIASKIRVFHDNRNLHHNDLKQRVLVPLRAGLHDSYRPLACLKKPAISRDWGTRALNERAKLTEEQREMGVLLKTDDPRVNVEAGMDDALFADAKRYHYARLVSEWQAFASRWSANVRKCERWVALMADRILKESGLPPFQSRGTYVMHLDLAVLIYERLFGLQTRPLSKGTMGQWSCLTNGMTTFAVGDDQQMDRLLAILHETREAERHTAVDFMAESGKLAEEVASLSSEVGLAIAERKLRGRCKMVVFL